MNLLDFLVSPAAAQAAGGPAPASPLMSLLPLIVLFIVFWFLLLRPQMKKAKEHRELVAKLQKGDEVLTNGGIAGRIEDLGESFVTVEVADKVAIKVQRGAITAVLPKGTLKSA
ncbi:MULTISPECIES: preprotein translocase subunit YajC [unclassified Arenimonas]|uniref:preprotein translocase subunit YajC n=1 Tax=unclassified Arenimonas TaxID=2641713 RepID=UPI0008690B0B|nr:MULTISPECIES: preprotein translocase subunit YajC [unclassified Arenimonas]ODS62888.1 MAG: preprotein translocase subunit YajC [Arenimonas sp. SCN 70-307]